MPTAFENSGKELAKDLISLSDGGTKAIPSRMLADTLCLIPEGNYAESHVQRLLPDSTMGEAEDDRSEGVWFLVLYNGETNLAYVKAIPQNIVAWEAPETVPLRDLVHCVSELDIVRVADRFVLLKNPGMGFVHAPDLVGDGL